MRVCVTGSTGYIGRHVVDYLKTIDNIDVIQVSRSSKQIGIDILKECENPELFKVLGCPDVLIHLAWRNGFKHHEFSHIEDIPRHFKFIKNIINSGCTNISIMGSMHEIGYFNGQVDESTLCNPTSCYGIAKNTLRQLCLSELAKETQNIKWLRGFYIYGDDQGGNSIFSKLIELDKNKVAAINLTTGDHKFDYIEIHSLAKQIVLASIQSDFSGIIHVGSGRPTSFKDMLRKYVKSHNLKLKLNFGAYPERPFEPKLIYGDTQKIETILAMAKVGS